MTVKAGSDVKNRLLMSDGAAALWASQCEAGYGLLGSVYLNIPELQYVLTEDNDTRNLDMYAGMVKAAVIKFYPF